MSWGIRPSSKSRPMRSAQTDSRAPPWLPWPKTRWLTCGTSPSLSRAGRGMEYGMAKALVKSKPEPGLWLEEVPQPAIGINDVLIQVDRTGICGTDAHIYKWDDWAQKTIPVPMAIG